MMKRLEGRRERAGGGQFSSIMDQPSPACAVISAVSGPFLVPQKQAAHVLLRPPKRLKCCRPVGTELWWDSQHHHAASPLSLNYLLPRNLSPTCSHWFRTTHPSPECLCAQIRLCACTGTHTHQSLAHCWHHLPSKFNPALAVVDRKGIKAETGTVCDVRKGVTKTRNPICSHSLTSQWRSWIPSLLYFGSLRMTSQGNFGWKYVGKREVKKKGLFYF